MKNISLNVSGARSIAHLMCAKVVELYERGSLGEAQIPVGPLARWIGSLAWDWQTDPRAVAIKFLAARDGQKHPRFDFQMDEGDLWTLKNIIQASFSAVGDDGPADILGANAYEVLYPDFFQQAYNACDEIADAAAVSE